MEHDLFGKPAATFPDHALAAARGCEAHFVAAWSGALAPLAKST
jgi:hypothetical protein